jgi:hypothetical protein
VRALNRLLSLLLGLALLVAGALGLVELAAFALHAGPVLVPVGRWLGTLRATTFEQREVLVGSGLAALAGLVLLLVEVWPRRPGRARLGGGRRGTWWLERATAELAIQRAVLHGTRTFWAHARLRPGARRWQVAVDAGIPPAVRTAALRPEVEGRARAALERLGAPPDSTLQVRIRRVREADR